jgi:hypothetical protein
MPSHLFGTCLHLISLGPPEHLATSVLQTEKLAIHMPTKSIQLHTTGPCHVTYRLSFGSHGVGNEGNR